MTEPRIIAINAAVSSKSRTAPFYVTALDDASSLLPAKETGSTFDKYMTAASEITVEVTTVDKECAARKITEIDILKMDAQGAELSILQGANKMLKKKSIKVVYLEVQFIRLYDSACLYHEIATFLAEHGYHLQNLYDLTHNQNGQLSWGDAIFVPLND